MSKIPKLTRKIPVKMELLSKEDRASLQEEARRSVLEEMTQDARDAYFAEQIAKIRREHVPTERLIHLSVDIAPFLPYIMIDGVQYFHGYSYDVEQSRAIVMFEQMQRSWQHQDEIEGRNRSNAYRHVRNPRIGHGHIGVPTRGANGIISMGE